MKTTMKTPQNIRKGFKLAGWLALMMTALLVTIGADASGGVVCAVAVPGVALSTEEMAKANSQILDHSVSRKITEMFVSRNPLNHIMRRLPTFDMYGMNGKGAYRHDFYGLADRPVVSSVAADYTATSDTAAEITLTAGQTKNLTVDDVLAVKFAGTPTADQLGYDYSTNAEVQRGTLQLVVIAINNGANKVTVQATNGQRPAGLLNDITSAPVPSIPAGTQFIRIGTSLGELDAQAKSWTDVPTKEFNLVQIFGAQLEVTPEMLEHYKEVEWGWAKLKSRKLRQMAEDEERALLLGMRSEFIDSIDQDKKHTLGGVKFYMDNTFEYAASGMTKADYNAMMKQLFANNSGDTVRYMFMGSTFAEQLSNIDEVQKQSNSNTPVTLFGVNFRGFSNVFGQVNTILHPMLDVAGFADQALILDFSNLGLVPWGGMEAIELDLKKSGQKNVDALFLKEKLTLEMNYPETHMWVKPRSV